MWNGKPAMAVVISFEINGILVKEKRKLRRIVGKKRVLHKGEWVVGR